MMAAGKLYFQAKYSDVDYKPHAFETAEYEECFFINCRFLNASFSGSSFINCFFVNCDLSNIKTNDTVFRQVKFTNSKLIGMQFDSCDKLLLSVEFERCNLNMSSFYGLKIPRSSFTDCEMTEADFTNADLSSTLFINCNLNRAVFENTNLSKCDFVTSFNFNIDPVKNKIQKAKFSAAGLRGLLYMYDIIIK